MDPALFDQQVKRSIGFCLASDLEDVPEEPGIYAWYLPMRGDSSSGLLQYLKSLQENIEACSPATSMSGEGRQRRFTLERNPPVFDLGSQAIQILSESLSPSKVQALAKTVLVLSIFAEPIYVGMTEANKGLRSRLRQHLQSVKSFDHDLRWSGSFRTRIAKVLGESTYLNRCVIAYMPVSSLGFGDNATRLLEHILIRTIRPAQSIRS